jgi:bifunctional non-homologous end joining protein LigD
MVNLPINLDFLKFSSFFASLKGRVSPSTIMRDGPRLTLRSRSCIVDGEAVACDHNGVASFDLIRYQRADESTFLYAFDLIEQNGDDLRRDPLEVRKAALASIVAKARPGIRFNAHMEGDGPTVFAHACKLGLEGIVSKRKDSAYRSGRSPDWLKMKNADAPAVKREEEEEWGKKKRR